MRRLVRIPVGAFVLAAALTVASSQEAPPTHRRAAPATHKNDTKMGPWRPDSGSPLAFAKLADASLFRMREAEGHVATHVELQGRGDYLSEVEIRSPKVFRIQYPWIHYVRKPNDYPISTVTVTSNGRVVDLVGTQVRRHQLPAAAFRFVDGHSVDDWVLGFPRFVMGAVRGENALGELLTLVLRPRSGYSCKFQICDVVFRGRPGKQRRITIDRTPAAAKRSGALRIQIVGDAASGVPVLAEITATPPDHPPIHITWLAGWRPTPKPFPDKDFQIASMPRVRAAGIE